MSRRDLLGAALAISIAAAGCGSGAAGPESVPGVTDDAVKLGLIADLTGPIAIYGQEISAGARLYLDGINDGGGVHGRRIELLVEDDGYQPPRSVAAYRKLVDRDGVFAFLMTLGTAPSMALRPMLERDEVPVAMAGSFSSVIYTPPSRYLFGLDPTYRMTSWIMLRYVRETLGAEDPQIGVIYQDDDLGNDGLGGLHEAAAHDGLSVVAEEPYKRGAVDFTTQVLNLKRAGASHVILWTTQRETAAVLKKAQELEWAPVFIASHIVADPRLVELAGDAAADLHLVTLLDLDSDDPRFCEYLDAIARRTPGHPPGFYHSLGYLDAQLMVEALQRAGRDLTREKLIAALESLDAWDENVWGLPFTYGPGVRGGSAARTFFSRVDLEKGKLVRVSEDALFEMPRD